MTDEPDGWIGFEPTGRLEASQTDIPGDISSAAFLLGAAASPGGGTPPPRRRGESHAHRRARGAGPDGRPRRGSRNRRESVGEPVADLVVAPGQAPRHHGRAEEVPGLIDEIPMLAALAARAEGTTVFEEVGELRVKESDRLALIAANLRALGVDAAARATPSG